MANEFRKNPKNSKIQMTLNAIKPKDSEIMEKTKSSNGMMIACICGLLLSGYAYYVETRAEQDNEYTAMCDISEKISCTKVFASSYGKGFGILGPIFGEDSIFNQPNGKMGIFYYIIFAGLGIINNETTIKLQVILAALSNLMSVYLAYLLYFVLEDFCVVCVSTYAVNFICLLIAIQNLKILNNIKKKQN